MRRGARFGRSDKLKKRIIERVIARICTKCGKNKPDEELHMCRVCLDKAIEKRNTPCIKSTSLEVEE